MTVIVDERMCAGTGLCEMVGPSVFEVVDGLAVADQDAAAEHPGEVDEALTLCPNAALSRSEGGA